MIVIVGAGPVGCFLGGLLAKAGKEVAIYEEHSKIGEPVQCTGIITKEIEKIIKLDKSFLVNSVDKVRVYSKRAKVEAPVNDIVIDRTKFDRYLAKKAKENGAKIYLNHKFIGIRGGSAVFADKKNKIKKVEAEVIIGADGPLSEVAKANDMFKGRKFYFGMQARVRRNFDVKVYETYFGSIAPGFFAWILPESSKIARIGIAAKKETKELFKRFLDIKKIDKKKIIDYQAGLIPIFNKSIEVKKGNVYLVGDAAGQVKATTGGGLVPGMKAAKILADCLIYEKDYEKELKKLKRELWIHLRLRKGLDNFSNNEYDGLIKKIGSDKLKKVLNRVNRDNPKNLVFQAIKAKPNLLKYSIKFIN